MGACDETMKSAAGMSEDTRAIALLCGHFGARRDGSKPLSPAEYHGLAGALNSRGFGPVPEHEAQEFTDADEGLVHGTNTR